MFQLQSFKKSEVYMLKLYQSYLRLKRLEGWRKNEVKPELVVNLNALNNDLEDLALDLDYIRTIHPESSSPRRWCAKVRRARRKANRFRKPRDELRRQAQVRKTFSELLTLSEKIGKDTCKTFRQFLKRSSRN